MTRSRSAIIMPVMFCLLLGVISTIALAWLCAAFVNPELAVAEFSHSPRADGGENVIVAQSAFGHTRINRAQAQRLLLDEATGDIRLAEWRGDDDSLSETRAGWPLRAFACDNPGEVSIVAGNSGMTMSTSSGAGSTVRGGWELSPFTGGFLGGCWRAIPLRPIWSGIVVDVIVLGGMCYAAIFGAAALRRERRRAQGLCAWCGYDLRSGGLDNQRCPECGR